MCHNNLTTRMGCVTTDVVVTKWFFLRLYVQLGWHSCIQQLHVEIIPLWSNDLMVLMAHGTVNTWQHLNSHLWLCYGVKCPCEETHDGKSVTGLLQVWREVNSIVSQKLSSKCLAFAQGMEGKKLLAEESEEMDWKYHVCTALKKGNKFSRSLKFCFSPMWQHYVHPNIASFCQSYYFYRRSHQFMSMLL